ncbi:hypothetical protein GJ496_005677 [Pomphorhynchus laevis]|nr:hypothetical protein GJ496_005677 [Pomphorhynchus laevis]
MAENKLENWPIVSTDAHTTTENISTTSLSTKDTLLGKSVFDKYVITQKLGGGSFGRVYLAESRKTGKSDKVAVKVESNDIKYPQLEIEYHILSRLKHDYFPKAVAWQSARTTESNRRELHQNLNMMAMELMGPNLYDLKLYCGNRFSLKTCLMLFDQMIDIMECLHDHQFIHRDVKPQNFVMGRSGELMNRLYIIDFGFAKRIDKTSCSIYTKQKKYKESITVEDSKRVFIGTPVYASLAMHKNIQIEKMDDIESCLYVIVQLLKGSLPWDNVVRTNKMTKKEWYIQIAKVKNYGFKYIMGCGMSGFRKMLNHIRKANLELRRQPDYEFFRNVVQSIMKNKNLEYDYQYDWYKKRNRKSIKRRN